MPWPKSDYSKLKSTFIRNSKEFIFHLISRVTLSCLEVRFLFSLSNLDTLTQASRLYYVLAYF